MEKLQPDLFTESDNEKITLDLFQAYFDARKNKRNTINALKFEKHLEENIFELFEDIVNRRYIPKPSICFIVDKPVKREIFAADFRDRVIHHFIYNYISPIFEHTFINDSYSCRKNKGTHYGISRVNEFIRTCSANYTSECYVLKLDIKGYFMAINKPLLYEKVKETLLSRTSTIDFNLSLVLYLIEKTIFNDCTRHCIVKGHKSDWAGLPDTKSLFHAGKNCGLPIGNLTSQLFGNIYLNEFDHFVKKELGVRFYGRYVDDFVLVHQDKEFLKSLIPIMSLFLQKKLLLTMHPHKIYLQHYSKGIQYLGVIVKPGRIYMNKRVNGNFINAIKKQNILLSDHILDIDEKKMFISSINSYLGLMKHYKTYKIRRKISMEYMSIGWWKYVYLNGKITKFVLKNRKPKIEYIE